MQNFGKIKNTFNGILVEGMVLKNDTKKQLFQKYVKAIKESDILKTQFLVYNNIENKIEADPSVANFFVLENVKLLWKFKSEDVIKENKKLVSLSADILGKINDVYDSRLSNL